MLNRMLLKWNRIIVPTDLRREVQNGIHSRHQEIEKCIFHTHARKKHDERNQQPTEPIITYEILEIVNSS